MALSELTGEAISVSFPESRLVAINDIPEMMGGPEARVAGVYVGFQGDLTGAMLLVIPDDNLLVLDNLLHRRPAGADGELSEIDLSSISEIGNILASCFINAIADSARLALAPEVPEISIDMCMSVIDPVLARFNEAGEKLLLTDAVILAGTSNDIVCHQVMFLDTQSLQKLMGVLDSPAVPAEA
jgi:chemotaxis protein CheC